MSAASSFRKRAAGDLRTSLAAAGSAGGGLSVRVPPSGAGHSRRITHFSSVGSASSRAIPLLLRPNPARLSRTIAWSSAERKLGAVARRERFRAAGDLAGAAQRIHQIARRQRQPMESLVKARPFGAITSAPDLTQRLASGTSAVMTMSPRPARSAIQLSASSMPGADDDALDKPIARHRDRAVADDEDLERHALERVPLGNAIHLLLHRAGIGVDVEGDGFVHWTTRITPFRHLVGSFG